MLRPENEAGCNTAGSTVSHLVYQPPSHESTMYLYWFQALRNHARTPVHLGSMQDTKKRASLFRHSTLI